MNPPQSIINILLALIIFHNIDNAKRGVLIFILLFTILFIYTYQVSNITNTHPVSNHDKSLSRNVSVFMGFEDDYPHETHIGFRGQELYSYATSKDIIIGYNYINMDKHWFLWILKTNHLSSTQFYWIEHDTESIQAINMINDIDFIKHISLMIAVKIKNNECDNVIIRPGRQRVGLTSLINKIRSYFPFPSINDAVITAIADENWMKKFGTKACLHRSITDINKQSLVQSVNMFESQETTHGLTELNGYICRNKDEILIAFDVLTEQIGYNNVVLKDCDAHSGHDIYFYDNKQVIIDDFIWKDSFKCVIVEQDLRYTNENGLQIETVEFVGFSFYDNEIIGGGHRQLIEHESLFVGSETYENKVMEKRLKYIVRDVMDKIGTKFTGGFDFGVQVFRNKNVLPKVYLVDFNTGRMTGTCQTFIIMRKFNIKNKYFIHLDGKIKSGSTFKMFEDLHSELLFDKKTQNGIYFHTFYPKRNLAIVSIFGNNKTEAYDLYDEFKKSEIYETM